MNPVGAENGMRICEKINNNFLSLWVRKQGGLGTSSCYRCGYAFLKSNIITELHEMLNTMNMASVLQGKDPPPLVNDLNHIWNISWSWITHWTVLYWHLNWRGRTQPPYCFSVKWKPTKRWKMNELGFGKNGSVKSAHSESIANDDVTGNVCLWKKLTRINHPLKSPGPPNPRHPQDHAPGETNWS